MKRKLAKLLILAAILVAPFALGRGLYYAPNDDSGLSVGTTSQNATVISTESYNQPSRLIIPSLDIDTNVQHVGLAKSGNMAAPNNFTDVSWWKYGTVPGYRGSAVMAGHEDNAIDTPAIFYDLNKLELGDSVYTVDKSGKKLHFKVVDIEVYPYDNSPLQRIFHASDSSYLVLITCAGDWLPKAKTNDKRLVVYTELVD